MNLQIFNDPWEYGIVDNFLSPERFKEIEDQAQIEYEKYKVEGSNTFRAGKYIRYEKDDIIPEITKNIINFQDHREYNKLVKLIHWVVMPPNEIYPCHIDNASRIHTSILYISPKDNNGTILCENPSTNDNGDHNQPDKSTTKEVEVEWKTNRLFSHNPGPKKWHRYTSNHNHRINLSIFFADPDKIRPHRQDHNYLIDI